MSMTDYRRRMLVDTWATPLLGTLFDVDGVEGAQCVDSAKSFVFTLGAKNQAYGHGRDFARGLCDAYPNLFEFVDGSEKMRPADTVSFGRKWGGGYGHVATGAEDLGSGGLRIVQQNPRVLHYAVVERYDVVGFARPKLTDQSADSLHPVSVNAARNETLASIGRRYGISVTTMIALNPHIRPENMAIGTLVYTKYVVQRGDNLSSIARKFGMRDWKAVQTANGLKDTTIFPGQTLTVK